MHLKKVGEVLKVKIEEWLILIGIGSTITLIWQLLELLIDGSITPSNVDSIVGIILSFSLYFNLKRVKA
ncbi:hypothetical protein [Clostridium sp. VAP51]|uniref:hypothetical protein n=1 Tax=Clostridium sp. VAP51 TaxID=2949978 RepID=UPI002079E8FF|nr:hypothetical protein [Clostridium sp. VAP51]